MNSLISCIAMVASLSAAGETSAVQRPSAVVENTAMAEAPGRPTHHLGILLDVGVPDGFGVSLAYRPAYWVRLELGMLENTVSPGVRGGLSLIPFNFWITPTLTVEVGHYFQGNANGLARMLSHSQSTDSPLLRDFNYDYGNAHLGLELGSSRVAFYLRGGLSYVKSTLRNAQQAFQQTTGDSGLTAGNIAITYRGPSAKLGLIIYFL